MGIDFEELDYRETRLGPLSLRRRTELSLGVEVYEVKLGEEFLMSSLFTEGEIALATLALESFGCAPIDVVVGGLGLGYTARAVLKHENISSLIVVEALREVIDWHRHGTVPLGAEITSDPRCQILHADFFALVNSVQFDPARPGRRFHAILLDIDHSPRHVLHSSHAAQYQCAALKRIAEQLHPGGVFAVWSNDPPDDEFSASLASAFAQCRAHVVRFRNPLQNRDAANTVYIASNSA